MNWNRSSGLRPIRLSTRVFVAARSSGRATTLSKVRRAGSIVVSRKAEAGISPRPLKRLISGLAFDGSLPTIVSRSASFAAQCVSFPHLILKSGGFAR